MSDFHFHDITYYYLKIAGEASKIEINTFGFPPDNHTLTITFTDQTGSIGMTEYVFVGTREGKGSHIYSMFYTSFLTICTTAVVSISLVGEEFVDVSESNLLLTIQLELTGFSYGVIPLQVIPVSYSQFEDARERLGINLTLMEIAGSQQVPSQSSVPCE